MSASTAVELAWTEMVPELPMGTSPESEAMALPLLVLRLVAALAVYPVVLGEFLGSGACGGRCVLVEVEGWCGGHRLWRGMGSLPVVFVNAGG
ncbi:hypothetical protein ABZT17_26035 [Streptomyces sp. NPDC005648]|uniref:hypothetical protein n=1 Tax=Streptomyces sp. NPDC005648 TaxID=3157044 RepID=UPI0033A7D69F